MKKTKVLCPVPFNHCIVSTNGSVRCCCYQSEENSMGNLNENTFDDIWNGDKFNTIREQMIDMEYPSICKCKEKTGNIGLGKFPDVGYYEIEIDDNSDEKEEDVQVKSLQIGAFYYIWYFQNWLNKCARTKLSEKQIPTLGEYNSLDREVISSHIDMANEAGIDFFIVCLTKELIEFGAAKRFFELYDEIVKTKEKYPKLTIQFETLSYFSKNKELSESDFSKLTDIFKEIEKTIYNDRIWFKYNGKITLFIYVSREIINIESFCQFMKSLFPGVYLFGDEVWYGDCNPKRLSGFDAVYAYNLYLEQVRYAGEDNTDRKTGKEFLKMAHGVVDRFATQSKMVFTKYVPTIMPRYNDTGVRPDVDHYVIPEEDGKLLIEYHHMVEPYIGDLLLVTSFNEWYEDTQIEPLGTADQYGQTCDEPRSITNGHSHKSYYKDYLRIIRDLKEGNIDKTYSIGEDVVLSIGEDVVLSINQNSENTFEDLVRNSFNA